MRRINRTLGASLVVLLLLFGIVVPAVTVFGQETEKKVIRVGYPIQAGLTEYDEANGYSGYTYDYLQEIAQYNGWEYEFVRTGDSGEELVELMEQLLDGKVDVISGLAYSDSVAAMLEFTDESYCTASTVLAAAADNASLTRTNFHTFRDAKVGTLKSAGVINKTLEQDLKALKLQAEIVTFETEEERQKALKDGEITFVVASSLQNIAGQGWKTVKTFNQKEYYFATTPGNTEVEEAINRVLQSLNTTDYFSQSQIADAHFPAGVSLQTSLTEEELQYLETAAPVTVLLPEHQAPLYYLDREGQEHGIALDLLKKVEALTGLHFSVQTPGNAGAVESQAEAESGTDQTGAAAFWKLLKDGEVDAAVGIPYDHTLGKEKELLLSHPFMECAMATVTNEARAEEKAEGKPVAAVSEDVPIQSAEALDGYEVVRYPTEEAALEALYSGEAQMVYGNSYVLQYYIKHYGYSKFQLEKLEALSMPVSFGLTYPADPVLMSILNKGISQLETRDLQEMVYTNLMNVPRKLSLRNLIEQYPVYFVVGILIAAVVISLILLLVVRNRHRIAKRARYEKQWYDSLAKVCNEYLFEYDYQSDVIRFSEELANLLHLPRSKRRWMSYLKSRKDLFGGHSGEILSLLANKEEVVCHDFQWTQEDGASAWYRLTQTVVCEGKRAKRLIGKFANVQNEYTEKDQLAECARRDSLTGVYNSAACNTMVTSRTDSHRGAAVVLDIDYFKEINDSFGHAEGDKVLRALAESMLTVFRSQDIVGRLGGDEFLVFMEDVTSPETVAKRCEQLAKDFVQRIKKDNPNLATTLSVGIYMAQTEEPFETIYVKADQALYESKRQGRNCYTFYHE